MVGSMVGSKYMTHPSSNEMDVVVWFLFGLMLCFACVANGSHW